MLVALLVVRTIGRVITPTPLLTGAALFLFVFDLKLLAVDKDHFDLRLLLGKRLVHEGEVGQVAPLDRADLFGETQQLRRRRGQRGESSRFRKSALHHHTQVLPKLRRFVKITGPQRKRHAVFVQADHVGNLFLPKTASFLSLFQRFVDLLFLLVVFLFAGIFPRAFRVFARLGLAFAFSYRPTLLLPFHIVGSCTGFFELVRGFIFLGLLLAVLGLVVEFQRDNKRDTFFLEQVGYLPRLLAAGDHDVEVELAGQTQGSPDLALSVRFKKDTLLSSQQGLKRIKGDVDRDSLTGCRMTQCKVPHFDMPLGIQHHLAKVGKNTEQRSWIGALFARGKRPVHSHIRRQHRPANGCIGQRKHRARPTKHVVARHDQRGGETGGAIALELVFVRSIRLERPPLRVDSPPVGSPGHGERALFGIEHFIFGSGAIRFGPSLFGDPQPCPRID